jgi:hypothetical protein
MTGIDAATLLQMVLDGRVSILEAKILRQMPSVRTIDGFAIWTKFPEPSVRRCLNRLVKRGLVVITGSLPPDDPLGRGRPMNTYGLVLQIPASCLHGSCPVVEPLPNCEWCHGTGRVDYESDDFPPGTNACCYTCSRCREEANVRAGREGGEK